MPKRAVDSSQKIGLRSIKIMRNAPYLIAIKPKHTDLHTISERAETSLFQLPN